MNYDYDLFVIGAGSGGVRAARVAAQHGARVAIAEESRVGGTCVIRGCVPKKLFVYAGRIAELIEDAAGFGWEIPKSTFDWDILKRNRDAEILRLEGLYQNTLVSNKVELFPERATLLDAHTVQLASGASITARCILIATGGRPSRPNIVGAELALVSDDLFNLPEQPKSIVIAGGGFIALEFASLLAQLGTQVTLIHRGEKPLRGFDEELRDCVLEGLAARNVTLLMKDSIQTIEQHRDLKHLTLKSGAIIEVDAVMLALGRTPNTQGLGLEAAGVVLNTDYAIQVQPNSQTSVPTIYAVGDVTNRVNLTPVAIREGHAFADSVFGNAPRIVEYDAIAKAVFTTPEVASVGLSELEAKEQGYEIKIFKTRFRPMAATLSGRQDRVLMKLVVDVSTDRVLGVHIFGPEAGEMIQLAAIAVKMKATKADFDATVAVHPTMAEELVTLK